MIRSLVVGYGYMGEIRAHVVQALDSCELSGICDPVATRCDTGWDGPHYSDFREAIEAVRPDLVFVCTPNNLSPEVCVVALESGCHVFCEKPPGRSVGDIKRIMAAEKARGDLKVMFGFNHRYHPAILEARSIVEGGRLGKILWVRGVYGKSGGKGRSFESSWRNDPRVSGGGILLDQGIHMLDLFRLFCGDFDVVQGILDTAHWNVPVEDNAMLLLRSEQGVMAQLHSSATLWKHTFELEIGLEHGYLVAHGLLSKTGSYGRESLVVGRRVREDDAGRVPGVPQEDITYFDEDLSWKLQVEEMARCISEDLPVCSSSTHDALQVMLMIDRVYRQGGRLIDQTTDVFATPSP
jgi:predicted dehydrogenase